MRYKQTKALRAALRHGRKAPTVLWCQHVEAVAVYLEQNGHTEFGGAEVLVHHLCDRVRWNNAKAKDIIAYLRELWEERVPNGAFPATPTKRPPTKASRRKNKKPDPKRVQRLAARYTLLKEKDIWKRSKVENREMDTIRTQLAKHGIRAN